MIRWFKRKFVSLTYQTKTNKMKAEIKALAEQIEADNELFNSMTEAEKRVVIAHDCIIRIHAEQIKAHQNQFFGNLEDFKDNENTVSIKETINNCENVPTCEVCAKGGLFLSIVGRVNNFTFDEVWGDNDLDSDEHTELLNYFSARQLAYIEMAFENAQHLDYDEDGDPIDFTQEQITNSQEFFYKFEYSNDRLIAICENIINNNGEFVL
jgi:hypothetical protein